MVNTIYTSYLERINIKNADVEAKTFEDIFNLVKNGQLKDFVQEIRVETDHDKVQLLKKNNLPIFFPTILINGEMKNILNEESTSTGIVQFDIDLKDNLDLNMVSLKDDFIKLPETFYVYTSPSNGLKIGIKTDFIKKDNESINDLKGRYLDAYDITERWLIEKFPTFNITFDIKVRPLKTACYLSDDCDAYFNQTCKEIALDHLCQVKVKHKSITTNQSAYREFKTRSFEYSQEQIKEMLSFIDPNRRHDKRIPINLVLMSVLGIDAIELLVDFWAKTEKNQLRYQLNNQFKALQIGKLEASIHLFLQAAIDGGYINPLSSENKTGSLRNNLKADDLTNSKFTLSPLLTPDEAAIELKKIVKAFFNDKQSRFINFSTGAGKTYEMLKILEGMGQRHKVLYLVKSHVLAEEITAKFGKIRAERLNLLTNPLDALRSRSHIDHLLGRGDFTNPERLCENTQLLKSLARKEGDLDKLLKDGGDLSAYKGGYHSFPSAFCGSDPNYYRTQVNFYENEGVEYEFEEDIQIDPAVKTKHETCVFQAQCRYTEQFNGLSGNIRVMTHDEYFNLSSKFFSGVNADGHPRVNIYKNPRRGWFPDYIVVDEDIVNVKDYEIRSDIKRFPSVAKIIAAVQSGVELKDAIMNNQRDIFTEALTNKKYKHKFETTKDYLKKIKQPTTDQEFSELFDNIYHFAKHEEDRYLKGMRISEISLVQQNRLLKTIPILKQSVVQTRAHRYRNTPTMFLDATANQSIVESLMPNVKYHSVNVKSRDDINLIQLQNFTFTKSQLMGLKKKELDSKAESKKRKTHKALDDVIFGLKKLADKYMAIGKAVGIISYKNIPEITDGTGFETFPEFLANEINISLYEHFGNLRGSNKFDEVGCLIILGRFYKNEIAIESYTRGIFDEAATSSTEYRDSPVRMKDGSVKLLNTLITINEESRAIEEHYSLSETLQAIGRGRMVHGSPKDIYYLSNEYIGSDIEVTSFVSYDDLFLRMFSFTQLDDLSKTGFIKADDITIRSLLGISLPFYKEVKDLIQDELKAAGFIHSRISYVKLDSKPANPSYFIKDEALLLDFLKPHPNPKHLVTIVSF
jgi:hypothetical protein